MADDRKDGKPEAKRPAGGGEIMKDPPFDRRGRPIKQAPRPKPPKK